MNEMSYGQWMLAGPIIFCAGLFVLCAVIGIVSNFMPDSWADEKAATWTLIIVAAGFAYGFISYLLW